MIRSKERRDEYKENIVKKEEYKQYRGYLQIAEIKHFTCKRVYTFQVHKFYLAAGNKHMIRVTAETKINLLTW